MYFKLFYSITYIVSYFSLLLDVSVVLGRFIQECTPSYLGISGILCGELVFIVYKFDLYISFKECINYTHQELPYMNASYPNPVMPHTQVWTCIDTRFDIPRSYVSIVLL